MAGAEAEAWRLESPAHWRDRKQFNKVQGCLAVGDNSQLGRLGLAPSWDSNIS